MNSIKFFIGTFLLLYFLSLPSFAQIQLNGALDLELSGGGEHSKFIANGIPKKFQNYNFSVTQLNAFLFAPITDQIFFESRIQLDTWGNGKLNPPRISLASLTWDNPDNPYVIRVGRFISPFGFYTKRQLSTDRVFVQHPLAYSYFTNISDIRGFWPEAGNNTNAEYEEGDVGLPTLYFAGYTNGIGASWEIKKDKMFLDAAITNGTPMTIRDRSTLPNLALTSRLFYRTSIFWEQGFSFSFGNFMQADPLNNSVRTDESFQKYYQLLLGTDTKIAFTYFEIIGEIIYSKWKTTGFISNQFDESCGGNLCDYNLSNISGNIDFKYELPGVTGSYIALRAEHLAFLDDVAFDNPNYDENQPDDEPEYIFRNWDEDVSRLTAVFGYKLAPNILLKASFSDQGDFDLSEYALRIQLASFF
jgi:hypothetical protein